ncbi:MAG TPA: hypothetical protein RMH85_24985 [Polyangiaceae bacterium LLY-WYZ-15_(1-7)]|nr:hypothetical protein [Polyangiaceae bacterium LLY-WYZ-15_(1-7)]HJL11755.1 hypothetical protein [Polyangiaceae bacterium LLY-WYZ-15_(1-7)]HJL23764.1 hypothetical protein [Polyangiaceae bacterium LLY-WYZ-15_(1-7)]HJL32743.1 hypothetical protein [Polyangiaceae bacterium LLY-WYZ-15_(1-7)]HJL50990.1 hypothetical protein [Polyangiaceae bacterium LLY-WYZ-15_(1-7)]
MTDPSPTPRPDSPSVRDAAARAARSAVAYAAAETARRHGPHLVEGARRFLDGDPRATHGTIREEATRRGHAQRTAYAGLGGLLGGLLGSFFGRFGAGFGALAGAFFGAVFGGRRDREALPTGEALTRHPGGDVAPR